nr:hypothetical protein [uncultured Tenacibaculum sp.]
MSIIKTVASKILSEVSKEMGKSFNDLKIYGIIYLGMVGAKKINKLLFK